MVRDLAERFSLKLFNLVRREPVLAVGMQPLSQWSGLGWIRLIFSNRQGIQASMSRPPNLK